MSGDVISLGYIVSTHGIKGHLKIKTFSGEGGSLLPDSLVRVKKSTGDTLDLKIAKSIPFKDCFIISFYGIDSINDALPLVKGEIYTMSENLSPTEEGEYYWRDLLDCEVYSPEGECLGRVCEIIETGGVDVIAVRQGGKEILLPLTESIIKKVEIREKRIIADSSAFIDED